MAIKADNKDKSMFYIKMRDNTDYDSRWDMGEITNYDMYNLKRADEHTYEQKKSIIKSYQVDYKPLEKENNEIAEDLENTEE